MADLLASIRSAVSQGAALAESVMVCTATFYEDQNATPLFKQICRVKIPRPSAFDAGNQTEESSKRRLVISMPTRSEGLEDTVVPAVIRDGLIVQISGADDPTINATNFTTKASIGQTFEATREIPVESEGAAAPRIS